MKINDLRVGNYINTVYPNFKIQKVTEIRENTVNTINIKSLSYSSILPILLTTERLSQIKDLNKTFTSDPQERPASKRYKLGVFVIHQPNEDEDNFIYVNDDGIIEVKYLHHFQNLYHALTQKEIEFK